MSKLDVNSLKQKDLIKGHPRLILIIKLAINTGVLKYCPQAYETEIDDDGNIRRDGYWAEDVTGFWNPSDFKNYYQSNVEAFKEACEEFGFWSAFKFLSLTIPWSGWSYVIDAKKTLAYDIVDDYFTEERSKGRPVNYNEYELKAKQVTKEEISKKLTDEYIQIHPAIWVSPNDPTCFIADEDIIPFAKKDGWNTDQIGKILEIWFESVTGMKVKSKYIENASW